MDVMRRRPLGVEILGISPYNKGALLMLEAIRARFREELPAARLGLPWSWPAEQRLALGLYSTYPRERGRVDVARLADLLPRTFRAGVGLLSPDDIDVVLDASGFAYGDYWGLAKLQRRLGRTASHWKTDRRTLILLPQALGPFEAAGMAHQWQRAQRGADLVFARDRSSMAYVQATGGGDRARLSPDFTNLLHPDLPARLAHVRGALLLVPNEKMVIGQNEGRRALYMEFLRLCSERFLATGRDVLLLVHEGRGDRQLAAELNTQVSKPITLVDEPSPLVTKAVIAAAHATVSSRFHGLVSALSAAVPSLACGWTHKYGELMADYGCPEFNVDLADRAAWPHKLDHLVRAAQDDAVRASLQQAASAQQKLSEEMWAGIFSLVRQRHGAVA